MGWLVLIAAGPMLEDVPLAGLILLAIGGLLYTIGIPFYIWERLPFRRAIWHGFVMAAAGVHYAAVLTGVVFARHLPPARGPHVGTRRNVIWSC